MRETPTPRQLIVFETVCRLGSQEQAAYVLGMSRSAVSVSLTRMYARMGATGAAHAAWLLWGPEARKTA